MDVKKIAIFINSLESGGAERVVSNLLNNLVDKNDCYLILIHDYKFYNIDSRVKIITLNENNTTPSSPIADKYRFYIENGFLKT